MQDNEHTTITPTEASFVPLSVLTEVQEKVEQQAKHISSLRSEALDFRNLVRTKFVDLVDEGDLSRKKANEVLDALGIQLIPTLFTVTVKDGTNMNTVLVVTGVEAEGEDEAIDSVRDHISVSAEVQSIEITIEMDYEGDGEVDDSDTVTVEEFEDIDLSDLESSFEYNLEYSAEEE